MRKNAWVCHFVAGSLIFFIPHYYLAFFLPILRRHFALLIRSCIFQSGGYILALLRRSVSLLSIVDNMHVSPFSTI